MSYYVPAGNWTNSVTNSLGINATNVLNYTLNVDSTFDPAVGCAKTFTATYKCGVDTTEKKVSIPKEAGGSIATFDCSDEDKRCNNLKLTLKDNGQLTLTTLDNKTILWDSIANGSFPTIDPASVVPTTTTTNTPSNQALTLPDMAGDGKPNKFDVQEGEGPGRRYPFNYLLAGQFLDLGQWIGSPSGTCRLIMGTAEAPNSLQVVTNILGCNSLDTPSVTTVDPAATRLYTIPDLYNSSKGKLAYIDNRGQLNVYPNSMTTYSNDFENIGNYSLPDGASLGPKTAAADVASCQNLCETNGDTQKCAGFVFDSTRAMCQLLDNKLYTQNRIIDPTASTFQFYARTKNASGQDISCPTYTVPKNTIFWEATPLSTANPTMSPSTTCGLANYTQEERKTVAKQLTSVANDSRFKSMFEALQNTYAELTNNLFKTNTKIDADFAELLDTRQKLADWSGEQLQNLEAMNEDRDLNMMSQNYRHIMWSILAIVIVIATMKIGKSMSSGTV